MHKLTPLAALTLLLGACDDTDEQARQSVSDLQAVVDAQDQSLTDALAQIEALQAELAAVQQDLAAVSGDYLTAAALDGYATETWVEGQGYATETFVTDETSATETWVVDQVYAAETWVTDQGYATETFVADQGYATEDWVLDQGYSTDTVDSDLAALAGYLSVDTSADSIVLSSANVYIQSGQGTSSPSSPNGLGNLIIGYDEDSSDSKTGSHNIVVGPYHSYTGAAAIIGGYDNTSGDDGYWTAVFGYQNLVDEQCATVTGGYSNTATGFAATVTSGFVNEATGNAAAVLGGNYNLASGNTASVLGGGANTASGAYSAVGGGLGNTASGTYAIVIGGYYYTASSTYEVE